MNSRHWGVAGGRGVRSKTGVSTADASVAALPVSRISGGGLEEELRGHTPLAFHTPSTVTGDNADRGIHKVQASIVTKLRVGDEVQVSNGESVVAVGVVVVKGGFGCCKATTKIEYS